MNTNQIFNSSNSTITLNNDEYCNLANMYENARQNNDVKTMNEAFLNANDETSLEIDLDDYILGNLTSYLNILKS